MNLWGHAPVRTQYRLNYARARLGDADCDKLPLRHDSYTYEEVDFSQNELTAVGLNRVLDMCILRCHKLRVLKLYKNHIDDGGAEGLAELCRKVPSIEEMHLSHNKFTGVGVETIVVAAESARPTNAPPLWLRFEQNDVADPEAVLWDLQKRMAVCARRDEVRCTVRVCCRRQKVHLPFFHLQRATRMGTPPPREGGASAGGAAKSARLANGTRAWDASAAARRGGTQERVRCSTRVALRSRSAPRLRQQQRHHQRRHRHQPPRRLQLRHQPQLRSTSRSGARWRSRSGRRRCVTAWWPQTRRALGGVRGTVGAAARRQSRIGAQPARQARLREAAALPDQYLSRAHASGPPAAVPGERVAAATQLAPVVNSAPPSPRNYLRSPGSTELSQPRSPRTRADVADGGGSPSTSCERRSQLSSQPRSPCFPADVADEGASPSTSCERRWEEDRGCSPPPQSPEPGAAVVKSHPSPAENVKERMETLKERLSQKFRNQQLATE